jgi:signal transduction histidine kinase
MKRPRWVWFDALPRWTLLLFVAMVGLLCMAAPYTVGANGNGLTRLDQAEFLASDVAEPPSDSAPWQPQSLPDFWWITRPDASGYAWYRLHFELARQPEALQAMHLPWLRNVGAVYLNGTYVGQSGTFGKADPVPSPQLFVVPPGLLRPGVNTLHIRLWVPDQHWSGRLSPIAFGERTAVKSEFDREVFIGRTGAQFVGLLSALVGIYVLFLWTRRRGESLYAYFGCTAIAKAAWIATYLGYIPLEHPLRGVLLIAIAWVTAVCVFLYCLRFAGWRWPKVERGLCIWAGASMVLHLISAFRPGYWLADNWWYANSATYWASTVLMAYVAWRIRTIESAPLLVGHVLSTAGIFYTDIWVIITGREVINFDPYHLAPLFLIMGWILVNRFAKSLNESEQLNAELEQRVEQKHAELERNYQRLHALEQQQAVVAERGRIMSDMHDGIGGQLISTLSLVENGAASKEEVAAALRECIDDLRLAIDSLEPTDDDLLPVLGNLRYRLEGRLKQQGITLDWQVQDVPKLGCLTPQNVLHILRILQEAFTNIVKHAQASRIRVSTAIDARRVSIDVSDNGRGFRGEHNAKGHGRQHARTRT